MIVSVYLKSGQTIVSDITDDHAVAEFKHDDAIGYKDRLDHFLTETDFFAPLYFAWIDQDQIAAITIIIEDKDE